MVTTGKHLTDYDVDGPVLAYREETKWEKKERETRFESVVVRKAQSPQFAAQIEKIADLALFGQPDQMAELMEMATALIGYTEGTAKFQKKKKTADDRVATLAKLGGPPEPLSQTVSKPKVAKKTRVTKAPAPGRRSKQRKASPQSLGQGTAKVATVAKLPTRAAVNKKKRPVETLPDPLLEMEFAAFSLQDNEVDFLDSAFANIDVAHSFSDEDSLSSEFDDEDSSWWPSTESENSYVKDNQPDECLATAAVIPSRPKKRRKRSPKKPVQRPVRNAGNHSSVSRATTIKIQSVLNGMNERSNAPADESLVPPESVTEVLQVLVKPGSASSEARNAAAKVSRQTLDFPSLLDDLYKDLETNPKLEEHLAGSANLIGQISCDKVYAARGLGTKARKVTLGGDTDPKVGHIAKNDALGLAYSLVNHNSAADNIARAFGTGQHAIITEMKSGSQTKNTYNAFVKKNAAKQHFQICTIVNIGAQCPEFGKTVADKIFGKSKKKRKTEAKMDVQSNPDIVSLTRDSSLAAPLLFFVRQFHDTNRVKFTVFVGTIQESPGNRKDTIVYMPFYTSEE
jgi:hypothetical protein